MSVFVIEDLRYSVQPHFWSRRRVILRGVSLRVEPGEIFGFVGPNGAGKTTTIKAVLDLARPDAGRITLLGRPASDAQVRRRIGYMPEHGYFPDQLRARELLLEHALLAGLGYGAARRRAGEVLDAVGLDRRGADRLRTFSKGMLQRVGLAQALVADPELVILDEPMSGLDPMGRRDIREAMLALRDRGKTVFFSTHILPDVEAVADRVGIIVDGETRRLGKLSELLGESVEQVEVTADHCEAELRGQAAALASRLEEHGTTLVLYAAGLADANALVDLLRAAGVVVRGVQVHRRSLEDIFVREATAGAASREGAAAAEVRS